MLLHGFIDARHPHLIWMAWSESPFAGSDFLSFYLFFLVNEATSRRDDGATSQRHRKKVCATFGIALVGHRTGRIVRWPTRAIPNVARTFLRCRCEVAPLSVRHRSVVGARYRRAMNSECRATHFAMSLRSCPVVATTSLRRRRVFAALSALHRTIDIIRTGWKQTDNARCAKMTSLPRNAPRNED